MRIIITLSVFLFSSISYAEIGKSVDDFKESKFAEVYSLKLVESGMVEEYISPEDFIRPKEFGLLYKGKKSFLFKSPKEKLTVGLIASTDGKKVVCQELVFPLTSKDIEQFMYAGYTISFLHEATGGEIRSNLAADTIPQMMKEVKQTERSSVKRIKGYTIRADYNLLSGYEIIICKNYKYTGEYNACRIQGVEFSAENPSVAVGGSIFHLNDFVCGGEVVNISFDKITVKFQGKKKDYGVGDVISTKVEVDIGDQPLDYALFLTRRIEHPFWKAYALARIAPKYAEVRQTNKAPQLLSQALNEAEILDPSYKESILELIAKGYVKIGDTRKALPLLSQILKDKEKASDDCFRLSELTETAAEYIEIGQTPEASQILSQVLQDAIIMEYSCKASVLAEIAGNYVKIGQKDKASEILSRAIQEVKKLDSEIYAKVCGLIDIADKYREIGQTNKISQILSQALEGIKELEDGLGKAYRLRDIATLYFEIGEKEKASQVLSQALKVAETIEDLYFRSCALANIAVNYSKELGQKDKASEILYQSFNLATKIDKVSLRCSTLSDIAVSYAKIGQRERAIQVFSQAIQLVETIENETDRVSILANIAIKYTELEKSR